MLEQRDLEQIGGLITESIKPLVVELQEVKSDVQDFKSEIKDCEELEIIDSKSACGKISGNGNGMEFYGAVLVKAECEEDVEELVSSIDDDYNKVGYYIQADKQIDASPIDGHIFLEYESFPNDGKTYYTVYYFTSHKLSTEFDIRAH